MMMERRCSGFMHRRSPYTLIPHDPHNSPLFPLIHTFISSKVHSLPFIPLFSFSSLCHFLNFSFHSLSHLTIVYFSSERFC